MRNPLHRLKHLVPERSPLRLSWHAAKAFAAAAKEGFPARRLSIIGITGTDGKTTTVAMTAHILRSCGLSVGAVSTTFLKINDDIEWNATHKTSLSPSALQHFLRRCVGAGCTHAIVEASSHGLVQHRLDYLWPSVAAITNTALEHLDYHGTMEQYRKDKGILFRMLKGKGTKVLHAEDGTFALYKKIPSDKVIVYSTNASGDADLSLSDVQASPTSCSAIIHAKENRQPATGNHVTLPVPGIFNLSNALCALGCAMAAGIPLQKGIEALSSFAAVPGRIERIDEGQPFSVFVDFTVTPQAYDKTLSAAREMMDASASLLVLTGSCGDRMREKRPMIGKIVGDGADIVVVTEDETITEDPLQTIEDVWKGIDQSKTEAHKIPDRREAIAFLLGKAKHGDVVLLCGMGACTTMQTREGLWPWDEREIARSILRSMH